jgi:hypothetical protein
LSLEASDERYYLHGLETRACNLIRQTLENYVNGAPHLQWNVPITTSLTTKKSQYITAPVTMISTAMVAIDVFV